MTTDLWIIYILIVGVSLWQKSAAMKIVSGLFSFVVCAAMYSTDPDSWKMLASAAALLIFGVWLILTRGYK